MIIPILLGLFTFVAYLMTACATFNINDSGETIMVCDMLSISHSPGYPLHSLFGRCFCLLPLGQPMFRVTLSSVVNSTLTVVMLYFVLRSILKKVFDPPEPPPAPGEKRSGPWLWEVPAVFGALIFAFSYQHWFQAGGCKGSIYTLNSFFSISMLYVFLKMRERGWFVKGFLLFGLLMGLSLAHSWPNPIVMSPGYLWLILTTQKKLNFNQMVSKTFSFVSLGAFVVCFVLGIWALDDFLKALALGVFGMINVVIIESYGLLTWVRGLTCMALALTTYLYLPLRAVQRPIINWWDPRTLKRLVETVIRKGYLDLGDKRGLNTFLRTFDRFMLHGHHQFGGEAVTFIVFLLSVYGLYWLLQRRQFSTAIGMFLMGFGVFVGIIGVSTSLEGYQWTNDNFFSPIFMMVSLFAACGLAGLCLLVSQKWPLRVVPLYASAAVLSLALMPLIFNLQPGGYDYADPIPYKGSSNHRPMFVGNDQSHYVSSYDEGINMLKTVNDDGVIICNGDIDILPLWYLQFVEKKRPKVVSFTMQLIPYDWYRNPLFNEHPDLKVALKRDIYGREDVRPEVVVQDMIDQHAQDRSFYFTNIFTAPWMRQNNAAIPDGFLWRLIKTKNLNYGFTSARLNALWDTYRLRYLDYPERGYWDEYTDVMKDSYGIGYDFTGYFGLMNKMPDIALWSFNNALAYRQRQTKGRIYMMLGETYMTLGNPSAAVNSYQQSIKMEEFENPGSPTIPYSVAKMGDAYAAMGDRSDAEASYRSALAVNPQQKEAQDGLQKLQKMPLVPNGGAGPGTSR
jgi:hypothetical protein